jgi:putative phage-type endonuclease
VTAVLLGRFEHDTPEWNEVRSRGLGGSEIAAVVGLSPWVSRFALWHRKRGLLADQANRPAFDWGHRLEPAIAEAWAEKRDMLDVERAGTYCHAERRWQLANVDRLLYDDEHLPSPVGLLEVKTAHQYDAHEWGPDGTDEIPPYYRCQVLWYMDVLGVPEAHLAVLIGGSDYREYVIPYSAEETEWLRLEGERFWHEVQAGIVPAIDSHTATYEAVRKMHPEIERGAEAELDADVYDAYLTTKTAADEATAEHRKAKAVLLDQMGQAQRATVNGEPVLRRQPGRGGSVSLYPVPKKKEAAA